MSDRRYDKERRVRELLYDLKNGHLSAEFYRSQMVFPRGQPIHPTPAFLVQGILISEGIDDTTGELCRFRDVIPTDEPGPIQANVDVGFVQVSKDSVFWPSCTVKCPNGSTLEADSQSEFVEGDGDVPVKFIRVAEQPRDLHRPAGGTYKTIRSDVYLSLTEAGVSQVQMEGPGMAPGSTTAAQVDTPPPSDRPVERRLATSDSNAAGKAAGAGDASTDATHSASDQLGFTKAQLRRMTGFKDKALTSYIKGAGVTVAGRGKRNHRYTVVETIQILNHILGTCTENQALKKCDEELRRLNEATTKPA